MVGPAFMVVTITSVSRLATCKSSEGPETHSEQREVSQPRVFSACVGSAAIDSRSRPSPPELRLLDGNDELRHDRKDLGTALPVMPTQA